MDINEKKDKNPWAICKASQKKHGFGKKKLESCILKVKKKTGYHESSNPADQIAEMINDDPNLISECQPNATWEIDGKPVHGVAFRDESWDQAMHDISDTWASGYKIMIFDDGLLMTNDTDVLEANEDAMRPVFYPRSVNDALAYARHYWWTENDPRAVNTGTNQERDSRPLSDQFPTMESIAENLEMMAPPQEKSVDQIEAEMDALLASLGPEAPVKPEVEPEVEPGIVPDAPEPTEPDPFNPTQPAIDPHPKACDY